MKKNLLLVLLAMVVCVSLVACGNDTSNEDAEYEEIIEDVYEDFGEGSDDEISDSEIQKILDDATLPSNEEIISAVKKCEEKVAELSGDELDAAVILVDDCLVCVDEGIYVIYSMENDITTGVFSVLVAETEDQAKEMYEQLVAESSGEDIDEIEVIGNYLIAGEKIEKASETLKLSDFEALCAIYGTEIIKL